MLSISQQIKKEKDDFESNLRHAKTTQEDYSIAINKKLDNTILNIGYCVVCEADGKGNINETTLQEEGFKVNSYPFSFGHGLRSSEKFGISVPFASKITNLGTLFSVSQEMKDYLTDTQGTEKYILFQLKHLQHENDGSIIDDMVVEIRYKATKKDDGAGNLVTDDEGKQVYEDNITFYHNNGDSEQSRQIFDDFQNVVSSLTLSEKGWYNIQYKGIYIDNGNTANPDSDVTSEDDGNHLNYGINDDDYVRLSIFFQGNQQPITNNEDLVIAKLPANVSTDSTDTSSQSS